MKYLHRLTCVLVLAAFAICLANSPAAIANQDLFQWKTEGEGGWLGVSIQNLTSALKEALDYNRDVGVLVNAVEDDSPAEQAGIQEGDIIIAYDGKSIANTGSLTRKVRASDPGDEVDIALIRKGRKIVLPVTIGERPVKKEIRIDTEGNVTPQKIKRVDEDRGWLGVHLQDLTGQLGDYFGITDGQGALITEVIEDSPAEKAGLKAGDVIVAYDGSEIENVEKLIEAVRKTGIGKVVGIRVMRHRRNLTLQAEIGQLKKKKATSSLHFFGVPAPEDPDDIIRSHKDLFYHREHFDKGESKDDHPPTIRMYGEIDKDEIRKLKRKIEKLEREIEKIKERL